MLKKIYFDRSTLPQGPVKMYTREQMERLQVRPRDTKPYDPPVARIPKLPARVEIPRESFGEDTSLFLDHNLLLASNGENHVQDVATAAGGIGGE